MTIIINVEYRTEIVVDILVVDRSSASPGAGRKRRRRSVAPSGQDLKRWQVIITKN